MADLDELRQAAVRSLQEPGRSAKPLPKDESRPPVLYLFRHTQTYDNIRRIFSGRRQTRLTPEGERQAKKLAEKLKSKKIDLFISPPLKRCRQTLEPLRKYFPNAAYIEKKELVERDYGDLTGRSKLRIMKLYPEKAILWRRSWDTPPPGGESLKQVWEERIKPFCRWLEKEMKDKNINIAYCGTNNTIRLIRMYFEDLSIDQMLTLENPYADYAAYSLGESASFARQGERTKPS